MVFEKKGWKKTKRAVVQWISWLMKPRVLEPSFKNLCLVIGCTLVFVVIFSFAYASLLYGLSLLSGITGVLGALMVLATSVFGGYVWGIFHSRDALWDPVWNRLSSTRFGIGSGIIVGVLLVSFAPANAPMLGFIFGAGIPILLELLNAVSRMPYHG